MSPLPRSLGAPTFPEAVDHAVQSTDLILILKDTIEDTCYKFFLNYRIYFPFSQRPERKPCKLILKNNCTFSGCRISLKSSIYGELLIVSFFNLFFNNASLKIQIDENIPWTPKTTWRSNSLTALLYPFTIRLISSLTTCGILPENVQLWSGCHILTSLRW